MTVYYIRAADETHRDFDQDLLVEATSYEMALELWLGYYRLPENDCREARLGALPSKSTTGVYSWDFLNEDGMVATYKRLRWMGSSRCIFVKRRWSLSKGAAA